MSKTTSYHINAMRPAFVKMRESGNRGAITKKVCEELGISETYFTWYKNSVEKLFNAVCNYCRLKNSPNVPKEELDNAMQPIYDHWKNLLSNAEKDKFDTDLRVTEHDISNLVGFCQIFVNDRNDVSRGTDKEFQALKVWATTPLIQFQKKVETDLGIRIAQVEVMSDADRDFLRAERKILTKWRKAERRIKDLEAQKDALSKVMATAKEAEMKTYLEEQIKAIDEQIEGLNKKVQTQKDAHDKLLNPPVEDENAQATEEPVAEATPVETPEPAEEPVAVQPEPVKPKRGRKGKDKAAA